MSNDEMTSKNGHSGFIQKGLAFLWFIIPLLLLAVVANNYISKYYAHLVPFLIEYIVPGVIAFFIMLGAVPLTMMIARKCKAAVQPEYPKQHLKAIPLLGGMAIFIVMLAVQCLYWPPPKGVLSIYLGAAIIVTLGTIDDVRPVSSIIRLGGQLLASGIIMSSGMLVSFFPDTLWGNVASIIITLVWILGIINAMNFMDGVDGLAGGITAIACLFFFLIAVHLSQYQLALMTSILAGCSFGFLKYNFKPARIYLGDGGSTLLGFLLASFALYGGWSAKGIMVALGIPVLILGVLIFDMIYITLSRVKNGKVKTVREWLDYRGRDHFHHRLINIGFKEEHAVLFILIICIILGLSALVLENTQFSYPAILLILQGSLIFVVTTTLMLVGREEDGL